MTGRRSSASTWRTERCSASEVPTSSARRSTGEAVTVRPGESPIVTDGPFAETKEAVGGFYVVDCATREEALELAARVPRSPGVAVEVLTIVDL